MSNKSKCPLSGIDCDDCGYEGDDCFLVELIWVLNAILEKMPDANGDS